MQLTRHWFKYWTVLMLSYLCIGVKIDPPVSTVPGDPVILVLFDFHHGVSQNGTCEDLSPRAVELWWTIEWLAMADKKEGTSSNPGLVVYDSCGSAQRALTITSHVLASCSNTSVSSVITYSSKEVSSAISEFLRAINVMHMRIDQTEHVSYLADSAVVFGTISLWKIHAALEIVTKLNWSTFHLMSTNTTSANTSRELFFKISKKFSMCVSSSTVYKPSKLKSSDQQLDLVVLFTSSEDKPERVLLDDVFTNSTVLIIGEHWEDLKVKGNNMMFYMEKLNSSQSLVEFVTNKVKNSQGTENIIDKYKTINRCSESANKTLCDGQISTSFLTQRFVGHDISATMGAFISSRKLIEHYSDNNCTDHSISSCDNTVQFAPVIAYFTSGSLPNEMSFINNTLAKKEIYGEASVYSNGGYFGVARVNNGQFDVYDNTTWNTFKRNQSMPSTETVCQDIKTCSQPTVCKQNTNNVIIMGQFPIRKSSETGNHCDVWNVEGLIMAESFMFEVKNLKKRFPKILQNLILVGEVYDSCGQNLVILDNSFGCSGTQFPGHGISGEIQLQRIHASVQYIPDEDILSPALSAAKRHFTVSSAGLSYGGVHVDRYIQTAVDLLLLQKWTYVNVIGSSTDDLILKFSEYIKVKSGKICISNVLNANNNNTQLFLDLKHTVEGKPKVYVLLTNFNDTSRVHKVLSHIDGAFSHSNYITFPWNSDIIQNPGTVSISNRHIPLDDVKIHIQSLTPGENSNSPLWISFHEDLNKCSISVRRDMLYPNVCANTPTVENVTFSDSMFSSIRSAVEAAAKMIDSKYKDVCPLQSGMCADMTMTGEIADLNKIEVDVGGNLSRFSLPGNLITDLDINAFKGNNSMSFSSKVGELNRSGNLSIGMNLIKTYNSDLQPYVTAHECNDWCPECHKCHSTGNQNTSAIYESGQLVFTGLFPIHKSDTNFHCDIPSLDRRSDIQIEAFLFALKTYKQRYPDLLPEVEIGYLILDTCSDKNVAIQSLINFENCHTIYSNNGLSASPRLVSVYVNTENESVSESVEAVVDRFGKFSLGINAGTDSDGFLSKLYSPLSAAGLRAIAEMLRYMDWTYVDLIHSHGNEYSNKAGEFITISKTYNICISSVIKIERQTAKSLSTSVDLIRNSPVSVAVVLGSIEDIREFLRNLASRPLFKSLVIGEIEKPWEDVSDLLLPRNSRIIVVERSGRINNDFIAHYNKVISGQTSAFDNPWISRFMEERNCAGDQCKAEEDVLINSKLIFGVDFLLHAMHNKYIRYCPGKTGLCKEFADVGVTLRETDFMNVSFNYLDGIPIDYPTKYHYGRFVYRNYRETLQEIGHMENGTLTIDVENVYDTSNQKYTVTASRCYAVCSCVTLYDAMTENKTNNATDPYASMSLEFFTTSAEFRKELWTMIVVVVAAGGAFVSFGFIFYVLQKVYAGLLVKRYIGLGILLLTAITFLFFTVLPFTFTPSKTVCATRFFLPGFAYTLCFATIITKLMTLRSYKLIGLGGEVSNSNQFLTVLFITGVQIAVGTHFWFTEDNKIGFLRTKHDEEGQILYACLFDREDFVKYLVYVMFLIALSALYSVFVRNETKNMGEAKFILVFSWICIPVWIAWITSLMLFDSKWAEVIVCVGILTCATLIVMIVFLPKLHRIARLKYDVKKSGLENGAYKIDPDFMFERPYTLPAISRTSFKYSEKTNPRSISTFDTSLSY